MISSFHSHTIGDSVRLIAKRNGHMSLPLTTNFSQKFTEPSKVISYPVGDICRRFTKLTGPSAYTLHSNLIPQTDGTNGLLRLVTYIPQTGHQCFPACFCHPTVGSSYVSPKPRLCLKCGEWGSYNSSTKIGDFCNKID